MSNLETLRAYHVDAQKRLNFYADDGDMRKSDVEHYRKRAKFHADMVAVIDRAATQQHPHNDGLDEYRQPVHVGELDPAQRLALARGEK